MTGAFRLMVLPAWLLLIVTAPVEVPVLMFVALLALLLMDTAPATEVTPLMVVAPVMFVVPLTSTPSLAITLPPNVT